MTNTIFKLKSRFSNIKYTPLSLAIFTALLAPMPVNAQVNNTQMAAGKANATLALASKFYPKVLGPYADAAALTNQMFCNIGLCIFQDANTQERQDIAAVKAGVEQLNTKVDQMATNLDYVLNTVDKISRQVEVVQDSINHLTKTTLLTQSYLLSLA